MVTDSREEPAQDLDAGRANHGRGPPLPVDRSLSRPPVSVHVRVRSIAQCRYSATRHCSAREVRREQHLRPASAASACAGVSLLVGVLGGCGGLPVTAAARALAAVCGTPVQALEVSRNALTRITKSNVQVPPAVHSCLLLVCVCVHVSVCFCVCVCVCFKCTDSTRVCFPGVESSACFAASTRAGVQKGT